MPPGRSLRSRASLTGSSTPASPTMSRSRRTASGNTNTNSSITVARVPSPDSSKKSIRLTVKMPSSKLREATSGGAKGSITLNSRASFVPGEIVSGPRGSRAKRAVVIESGSEDEDDEEEDAEEEDDEDAEAEDEEEDEEAGSEEDAEGEDDEDADGTSEEIELDAGGDTPMEDPAPPPPPIIRMRGPASKPSVTVTPAKEGKVKSVEAKEMQPGNSDDEELSDLESAEGEEAEGGEEDAEGEDVGDEDQDMDQDEDDADSDADTPAAGSRASTPDVSKMTKRQRSRLDQVIGNDFLQLPMEPQIKKHLTAEEHAMRRVEMARRRKNLSEKRNEEEKMDTINRLLKKQAPKRRGKISAAEIAAGKARAGSGDETPAEYEMEVERANPVFVRWVSGRQGVRVGVPAEWEGGVGRVFGMGSGKAGEVEG
ncbi:hypothetical protein MMC18_001292 [Xylographa bjoerkii]|nr:hypothetical protein [Xylographa bjoerkii]